MADARKPRRRSRRDLDAVADGAPDETPLGAFVSEMRAMGARDGVEPNQTLTEFVSAPRRESDLVVASTTPPKARTPMIAQLSALAATTVGKVAISGGIAAAAVGGAVVVNEIQDPNPVEVVATADDSTSTTASSLSATPDESTSTTASTVDATPDDDDGDESAPAGSSTHPVLDAGSVTVAVDGLSVSVVSADPNPGWTAEIETDEPGEAQVNFRNGDARVDFRAEIDDGQLRIRIRDRRTDTETETFPNSDDPAATPASDDDDIDDDIDDDEDRSGSSSGSDDDDEDRSGSNSGSDDDDEDRSGSNSGSDDDDEDRSGSNSGSG